MEKRFWIGLGLLVVLLAVGLWGSYFAETIHKPIGNTLQQASQVTLDGDLEQGLQLISQAHDTWQSHWRATACMTDHEPMEEIDSVFAMAQAYGQVKNVSAFAACCARLSKLVEAMTDVQQLRLWNLM